MNQEIKAKWVAALRSGEYGQTIGVLKDNAGDYCCLGVLCELHRQETGFGDDENLQETDYSENLGATVKRWAGLPASYGAIVSIKDSARPLSDHNDDGCTFLEIADAIEEQL